MYKTEYQKLSSNLTALRVYSLTFYWHLCSCILLWQTII